MIRVLVSGCWVLDPVNCSNLIQPIEDICLFFFQDDHILFEVVEIQIDLHKGRQWFQFAMLLHHMKKLRIQET